jgi:hypothetical protein
MKVAAALLSTEREAGEHALSEVLLPARLMELGDAWGRADLVVVRALTHCREDARAY